MNKDEFLKYGTNVVSLDNTLRVNVMNSWAIVASKYCINCTIQKPAYYTYKGNSLCEDCFKKSKTKSEFVQIKLEGGESK